jgi:ABC-2 type transport system ATP-binding protein
LDEPTVGLDVPSRRAIVDYIHELCRTHRIAALWATHLIDEIEPEDRLVVLHRGQIRAQGSVAEVLSRVGAATVAEAFHRLTREEKA